MDSFIYILLFVVTIGSGCIVAFSKNLVYSAFALIGTFMGVAGTFVVLNAPFLGIAQVVVYAGGILVLTIFAVMLTAKMDQQTKTNPVINYKAVVPLVAFMGILIIRILSQQSWAKNLSTIDYASMTQQLGNSLLNKYFLPFELVSVVLLMSMIGAAIISRRSVKS